MKRSDHFMGVAKFSRNFAGKEADHSEASTPSTDETSADDTLLACKYRDILQHHLRHLPNLFRSLTGLSCRISWTPTWPQDWSDSDLPIGFPLCRCLISRSLKTLSRCRGCARGHLRRALSSSQAGHRFTCFLGVHNYWQPILIQDHLIGLAFIQALDTDTETKPAAAEATACRCATDQTSGNKTTASATPLSSMGRGCRNAHRMTRAEFERSSRLFHLIFAHAETLTLADLRQVDLEKARQALHQLQAEASHMREDLNELIPEVHQASPAPEKESRRDRIVHDMLDEILHHYSRPITLQDCARRLRLNASYLSALFSRRVGLPFKTYLTELRIERARQLLSSIDVNISEIATAVGYTSENRFRIAFKKATGLSPKAWREILRLEPTRRR